MGNSRLLNEWYVLLYHNVSFEDNAYVRGLGGTVPPDVLRDHLAELGRRGELVSVGEALRRLGAGEVDVPMFSLWFDDGFSSVRSYAAPLLDAVGVTAALSVCSRFVEGSELFWRMKLSYLAKTGALPDLRRRMRRHGCLTGRSIKDFTMEKFSAAIVEEIDRSYAGRTSEAMRDDAFRMFESVDGLTELRERGWVIANHTAAHHPVGLATAIGAFADQFEECEGAYVRWFGERSTFWVLPFDRDLELAGEVAEAFGRCGEDRYLVLVGNRGNGPETAGERVLHRVPVPLVDGDGLIRHLESVTGRAGPPGPPPPRGRGARG
jgi:peptidoglycan/xylan/chitin deacetylase (PgdA/CDA1 family)